MQTPPLRLATCLALLALAAPACAGSCGHPTDEERLREQLDTSSVRLYLALKAAATSGDRPEVASAHQHLLAATRAPGETDLVALAGALWELRALGGDLLDADLDGAEPAPILPALLAVGGATAPPALDAPTEHGLLLAAWWALKMHPRSPVPIPPPVLLYEAWKTDPAATPLPGAAPWLHTIRAWVFGTALLCDLAARDAAALPTDPATAGVLLGEGLPALGAAPVDLAPPDAARLATLLRGIAHGQAGLCYLQRDEDDDDELATPELRASIDAAGEAGIPPTETALVRAWLSYREGDLLAVEACLDERLAAPDLTDDERELVGRLRAWFADRDDGALAGTFDSLFFASLGAELLARELERSGATRELTGAGLATTLRGFGEVVGAVVGAPERALDDLRQRGAELLE